MWTMLAAGEGVSRDDLDTSSRINCQSVAVLLLMLESGYLGYPQVDPHSSTGIPVRREYSDLRWWTWLHDHDDQHADASGGAGRKAATRYVGAAFRSVSGREVEDRFGRKMGFDMQRLARRPLTWPSRWYRRVVRPINRASLPLCSRRPLPIPLHVACKDDSFRRQTMLLYCVRPTAKRRSQPGATTACGLTAGVIDRGPTSPPISTRLGLHPCKIGVCPARIASFATPAIQMPPKLNACLRLACLRGGCRARGAALHDGFHLAVSAMPLPGDRRAPISMWGLRKPAAVNLWTARRCS